MLKLDLAEHVYRWNGQRVPSATGIIRGALGDPFERVAAGVLAYAQQRGRAVHKACELDDAGQLNDSSVDERISPYVEAWRKFRREYTFKVIVAEWPMYSETLGFAGTPDCVIEFADSSKAVLDRKTGLPGIAAALQTAAYAHLAGDEQMRRFALRMMPTGRYQFDEYRSPSDWRDFLACLAVCRLKERIAA